MSFISRKSEDGAFGEAPTCLGVGVASSEIFCISHHVSLLLCQVPVCQTAPARCTRAKLASCPLTGKHNLLKFRQRTRSGKERPAAASGTVGQGRAASCTRGLSTPEPPRRMKLLQRNHVKAQIFELLRRKLRCSCLSAEKAHSAHRVSGKIMPGPRSSESASALRLVRLGIFLQLLWLAVGQPLPAIDKNKQSPLPSLPLGTQPAHEALVAQSSASCTAALAPLGV